MGWCLAAYAFSVKYTVERPKLSVYYTTNVRVLGQTQALPPFLLRKFNRGLNLIHA